MPSSILRQPCFGQVTISISLSSYESIKYPYPFKESFVAFITFLAYANETRFKQSKYIEVGDKLVEFNYNTNTARTVTVATVGYRTSVTYAAELDVEQADVFTVAYDTSDENVGFAIHNKEPALCECQYCSEGAYDAGTCLSSPDCSTFYSACTQGGYPCFGYTYSMPDGCTNGEGKE